MSHFEDAFGEDHAALYDEQFARLGPLKEALHLALDIAFEPLPNHARVLMVGVGTGQELIALSALHSDWHFVAVDPSAPMLARCQAKAEAAGVMDRCTLHVGTLAELPPQPLFHAATSILVSHFFTDHQDRRTFLQAIADRLAPGGMLFEASLTEEAQAGSSEAQRTFWRSALRRAMPQDKVDDIFQAYGEHVALEPSLEVQGILREAGFASVIDIYQFGLIRAFSAEKPRD